MGFPRLVRVRTFVIGGLLAVGLFMIGDRLLFTERFEIEADFGNVAGIAIGTGVRLAGFDAGEVLGIEIPLNPGERFLVRMRVREDLRPLVRTDSVAAVLADGLLGSAFIQIRSGSAWAPTAEDGDRIRGVDAVEIADLIEEGRETFSTVADEFTQALGDLSPPVIEERRRGGTSAERGATGLNAFLLAAANAHYELAALLVDRSADVNVASRGWTALHQVSWVRKAGIAGSNNPAPKGSGAMTSLEFVKKIVAAGAALNARVTTRPPAGITRLNFIGGTPLLLAARTGDAPLMRLLAELGADPLLPNEDGTTPLMVAAGVGISSPGEDPGTEPEVLEAVEVVLALGGDLNGVDDNGETVMHGAANKHVPTVVAFLAEAGADPAVWNRPNSREWTPLDIVENVPLGRGIQDNPATAAAAIRAVMERGRLGDGDRRTVASC